MRGTKKRQETASLRSSSLRRESVSTTKTSQQTTNVGCMSGVFQFVCKYHTRRKFLTFGKKPDRQSTTTQSPQNTENATFQSNNNKRLATEKVTLERIEVPRSPVIPQEIRQSSTTSINSPLRAVANQMSHNDITKSVAIEKRRKLLGALEKCDEDLQKLKSIIKTVRGVQTPRPTSTPCRGGGEEEVVESEEPSPMSVLDHHKLVARSPNISCSKRTREDKMVQHHRNNQMQQITQHACRKRPSKPFSLPFMVATSLQSPHVPARRRRPPESRWSSATRESVIEVCNAVELGQRLEIRSLVLVIEDVIFRDLVSEIVREIDLFHDFSEGFKRKLLF